MNYGVDLHSNNFIIAYRDDKSNIVTRKYYLTDDDLKKFKSKLTKEDVLAVESTITSYYFYDEISPLVKEVKIIHAGKFKIIVESTNKNDKRDAKAILEFLELGLIPEIKIPSKEIQALRNLFSTYQLLVKHKTAIKNRVYALLKNKGITISKKDPFSAKGIIEINKNDFLEQDQIQLEILLDEIKLLETKINKLKLNILTYNTIFYKEIELLITIPGISPFIALAIMTDIGDINNFSNPKRLCSYLGIVPRNKNSNEKRWSGKITKAGRKLSRSLLSQIIFHFIKSSKLYEEYYQVKKKEKGSGKALLAMMRKLVVIIFHMLKNKTKYHYIQEKNFKSKLNECLKTIEKFKKIDDKFLTEWEHEVRVKYDLNYRKKKEKLKKFA